MKIIPVGQALSLFFAITFALLAALHLSLHASMHDMMQGGPMMGAPSAGQATMNEGSAMHRMAQHGAATFFIGLAISYALGWYTALLYVPLHNLFNRRKAA